MEQLIQSSEKSSENIKYEKPYVIRTRNLPEKTTSRFLFNERYLKASFLLGMSLMAIYSILVFLLGLDFYYTSLIGMAILLLFISAVFFLFQPRKVIITEKIILRDIAYPAIKEIKQPVVVYVDKPVEKIVEKPIVKEVVKYVEKKKPKLDLPKFKYLASIKSRTFHKRTYRLSKRIKKKYKLSSNSTVTFRKKRFKACKNCFSKKS